MKFKISSVYSNGLHEFFIQYPQLKKFDIEVVQETEGYGDKYITINSLEEFKELTDAIKQDIIIDKNFESILIYDGWIE